MKKAKAQLAAFENTVHGVVVELLPDEIVVSAKEQRKARMLKNIRDAVTTNQLSPSAAATMVGRVPGWHHTSSPPSRPSFALPESAHRTAAS